jgi:hypothetical protein
MGGVDEDMRALEERLVPFGVECTLDEDRQQVEVRAETEEAEATAFVTLDMLRYAAFEDPLGEAGRKLVVALLSVRRN